MKKIFLVPIAPVLFRLNLLWLCFPIVLLQLAGVAWPQTVPISRDSCNGTFTGNFKGDLIVTAGQTCRFIGGEILGDVRVTGGNLNLDNTTVSGNVQLQEIGNLVLSNATVLGDVQVDGGGTFSIGFASIKGDLHIQNIPAGSAQNQICATTVTGNLQFKNNGTAVQIGTASDCSGNKIGGVFQIQNNSGPTAMVNNIVNGDAHDQNNTAPTLIVGNFIGGNLQVQNNTAATTVASNDVQMNLTCRNNALLSGGANTAGQNQGCPTALQVPALPLPPGLSGVGPVIESSPPTAAVTGQALQYQVTAFSANPASLAFSLASAPAGMAIDATSGLMAWTPGLNQAGDQPVTVVAQDSNGQTSQSFTLSVFGTHVEVAVPISAANGGVIAVNDPSSIVNGLSINIPAGALASDTTITISSLISPPTLGGTTHFWMQGFSIEPDLRLATPATLTVPYNPNNFGATDGIPLEGFLGVYSLQTSTGNLEFLSSYSVDTTNHVVTASLPHFSVWEITNVARLCPPPTGGSMCPSSYSPSTPSLQLPVVTVHGFQLGSVSTSTFPPSISFSPMPNSNDESTWADLRVLLGKIDVGDPGRIDAWRFDWDSLGRPFEESARNLHTALLYVESHQPANLVNLVAHSFGGILVRTYLQNQALGVPYAGDVNSVMTLGTPHTGIGGDYSNWIANTCVLAASYAPKAFQTCFEAGTGADGFARFLGEGDFLTALNGGTLPSLASQSPNYLHITGRNLKTSLTGSGTLQTVLTDDDGLIALTGAQLCANGTLCSRTSVTEETFAGQASDAFGLCHSPALIGWTCDNKGVNNAPMAAIDGTQHPLWITVCQFLGCEPAVNVTLSGSNQGTVTSSDGAINCGATCSAIYPFGSSVTLTAQPPVGSTVTWSGCTSITPSNACLVTIASGIPADYSSPSGALFAGYPVTASFTANNDVMLTIIENQGGTVISTPPGISCNSVLVGAPGCTALFPGGSTVILKAIPNSGFYFSGWNGIFGPQGTASVLLHTMKLSSDPDPNHDILVANFGNMVFGSPSLCPGCGVTVTDFECSVSADGLTMTTAASGTASVLAGGDLFFINPAEANPSQFDAFGVSIPVMSSGCDVWPPNPFDSAGCLSNGNGTSWNVNYQINFGVPLPPAFHAVQFQVGLAANGGFPFQRYTFQTNCSN